MRTHILILGGEKGSWQVRGHQIGEALGATVTAQPRACHWMWADLVICVKQALAKFGHEAKRRNLPVIWDALDFWQQPQENTRTQAECVADIAARWAMYRPCLVIGATKAMASATGGVYIPHHSRPGLVRQPIRRELKIVAYEGRAKYLDLWLPHLKAACTRLGAQFVVNPKTVTVADVLVSLRGGPWDGWACREWKSGIKYVNAVVAGRPIVTQPCAAFDEIHPVGVTITTPDELEGAIEAAWRSRALAYAQAECRAKEFALATIAQQYRSVIRTALRAAA